MIISFQSPGLIDPRCISTIGVSVKESENPIGFFGTGLKYAIAIILRGGGKITIWRGLEPLVFTAKKTTIRGAEVHLVCMNEQELGFTVELGKQWQPWQAFRELWCNTMDEQGACIGGKATPAAEQTTIHVDWQLFAEAWRNRDEFILSSSPLQETPEVEFHPGPRRAIFYRGLKVYDEPERLWRFVPNLLEQQMLTEDRTLMSLYDANRTIAKAILMCDDEVFIRDWLTSHKNSREHTLDIHWPSYTPSAAFMRVGKELLEDTSRIKNVYLHRLIASHEPPPEILEITMLPSESHKLQAAVTFCKRLQYNVDEFPIKIVESLGDNVLGQADREKRQILISKRALQMGDLTIAGTLIEEWAHIKHGVEDCTRGMQNWLVDNMCRLGEAYLFEQDRRS